MNRLLDRTPKTAEYLPRSLGSHFVWLHPVLLRQLRGNVGLLVCMLICGCDSTRPVDLAAGLDPPSGTAASPGSARLDEAEVRSRLDRVLQTTFDRRLYLHEHAAWQILHGVLAYGRDFRAWSDQSPVSVVDYLRGGGRLDGWTVEPGITLYGDPPRRGLRAIVEPGTKTGQGHHDQWFAVLAQAGLQPDETIVYGNHRFSVADWVEQVKWDLPRNLDREYSWTLIGLTSYLPTTASWQAQDGETWSIPRLLQSELDEELATSACGGSHRLIGIAMTLNQHLAQGGERRGIWETADQRIQAALENAHRFQNPDGSFSTHYFARPGTSPDLAEDIGATGHTLEFITLAANDAQLREAWVERAALHLCEVLRQTAELPLECGALYHAAHGLMLYRLRRFGEFHPQTHPTQARHVSGVSK